jgi:hypothetical protein
MSKPIIVVFGATGKSGGEGHDQYIRNLINTLYISGGMIDYLLKDGSFAARAVTRNPESASAKGVPFYLLNQKFVIKIYISACVPWC